MSEVALKEMLTEDLAGRGDVQSAFGENVITVQLEHLTFFFEKLKSDRYSFDYLTNLTAVDYEENFTVIYNFRSLSRKYKLTVRVVIDRNNPELPSATGFWKTADWQEREVFDMMGIRFAGHPDLKKILLSDEFEGHPLRKDFKYESRRIQPEVSDPDVKIIR